MSSLTISLIIFASVFAGALLGMVLRARLPQRHFTEESKDVVRVGMGLIGTITALVLGLMIASAKNSYDAQRSGLAQMSANIILLDRLLAHYGPDAKDARADLQKSAAVTLDRVWPADGDAPGRVEPTAASECVYEKIQDLAPRNDGQRALQAAAIKTGLDIAQSRWLLFAQKGSSIPTAFLIVLTFWLAVLFASFSLFARPNAIVLTTLFVSALSVSGAIFLILELDRPFEGLVQIPSVPLRRALEQLGR